MTRGSVQNRLTIALAGAAGPLTCLQKSASRLPRGQFCEAKPAPNDPTMEVAFLKHDLRNNSAFGEDGIGANRPELQCKMQSHFEYHAFYTVALACQLRSHPSQRPKYSLSHASQNLLPWWGQLEGVWAHRIDAKVISLTEKKIAENSIK